MTADLKTFVTILNLPMDVVRTARDTHLTETGLIMEQPEHEPFKTAIML